MLDIISTLDYLSWSFLTFVAAAFLVVRVVRGPWRSYAMLACNSFFLINLLPWPTLGFYILLTLAIYYAGLAIGRGVRGRRLLLHAFVVLLIGLFFALRSPLARGALGSGLEGTGALGTQVAVVLGYSYFMFKGINYLVSAYVGSLNRFDLPSYLNFMFFFSSFTAGPIGRFVNYQNGAIEPSVSTGDALDGIHRILNGLIKKYVLVDIIARFSLAAFDGPDQIRSVPVAWAATWAYLLYVYVDFSAYSDIAIGIARLFGHRLPENFHYPLFRRNLVLFWEHWHMSLTSWIRDHVFVPLSWKLRESRGWRDGGGVLFGVPHIVTMVVFGIWHAPTLAFLVFGFVHGTALAATQTVIGLRRRFLGEETNRMLETHIAARVLGAVGVNAFVALTLILIRYDLGDSSRLMVFLFTGVMP